MGLGTTVCICSLFSPAFPNSATTFQQAGYAWQLSPITRSVGIEHSRPAPPSPAAPWKRSLSPWGIARRAANQCKVFWALCSRADVHSFPWVAFPKRNVRSIVQPALAARLQQWSTASMRRCYSDNGR